jgi:hypothetical protein
VAAGHRRRRYSPTAAQGPFDNDDAMDFIGDLATVADLLAAHPFDADDSLRSSASAALVRVAADEGELMELWDEAGLRKSAETVYGEIRASL